MVSLQTKISKINIKNIFQLQYILIIIFVLFFTFLSMGRNYALKSYLHDLGNIDQVVWNTLHGNFFKTTSNLWQTDFYLGDHFSPILILFVPFSFFGFGTEALLFFQVLAIALIGLPIFEIARKKLKSDMWGYFFLVLYFLYPAVHNTLLYDFHQISIAAFFLAFAFYFLVQGKKIFFSIFSILAILCQEEIALLIFALSIYAFFQKEFRKIAIFLMIFSFVWFFGIVSFVMPRFNENGVSALSRYSYLGASGGEIIKNIVFHPSRVLNFLNEDSNFSKYLFSLFFPLLFLSILSPILLIALPIIAANLLSTNLMMSDIFFYHSIAIVPFIFFSAIYAFSKLERKIYIAFLMVFATIISVLFYSVSPFSLRYTFADYRISPNAAIIMDLKPLAPEKYSLSVQHNLGPHFSEREKIYVFPRHAHEADLVLVDLFDPYIENSRQIFKFPYALQMNVKDWIAEIEKMFEDKNYGIIYYEDGYFLFKRGAEKDLKEAALRDFQIRKKLFAQ